MTRTKGGLDRIPPILRLFFWMALASAPLACGRSSTGQSPSRQIIATARQYAERFYPLWFTYYQSQYVGVNRMAGPDRISPIYQIVVAINHDTLYASSFIDVTSQPIVVTIPSTAVTYSILTLDPYGNIFDTGIPAQTAGVFALCASDFAGSLPASVTRIDMPVNFSNLIFRADKFAESGQDQTVEADLFRRSLLLQPLSDYISDPTGGATLIAPEFFTAVGFKTAADALLKIDPITFLKQLQVAVESSNTPPMTAEERALADRFNVLFGDGTFSSASKQAAFSSGAQSAHEKILDVYLQNVGSTNWIHFTDIGQWGSNYLERASITEFIQFGNGIDTAAYYQAFKDATGAALDGSASSYVLTFPAGQIPEAKRFWSVTAYTPQSIELIPNSANKYVVASYTSGLVTAPDGSISIYMAQQLPDGVPEPNWLPVPDGPFNVMLRVYGPEGSVADNTYVPPAVREFAGN